MLSSTEKAKIEVLFNKGRSYLSISNELAIGRNIIRRYCYSIGLKHDISKNVLKANKRTAKKNKKPTECYTCENCNIVYIRNPRRHSGQGTRFCGRKCAFEWRSKNKKQLSCKVYFKKCQQCGNDFVGRFHHSKFCSERCSREHRFIKYKSSNDYIQDLRKQRNSYRNSNNLELITRNCIVCGSEFETYYNKKITCGSNKCNKKLRMIHKKKRRATTMGSTAENISISILFKRDNRRCHICKRKLNLKRKVPHPLAATIDHIIPVSLNGTHEYKNVKLCCFKCNCAKSNHTLDRGEQLLMFG